MGVFATCELQLAKNAIQFTVFAANQDEVGRCNLTVNCARDHSTLRVTGSTSSVQFSERGLRQSYGIKCECDAT